MRGFSSEARGRTTNQNSWRNDVWGKALAVAGLVDERELTPHKLRHTAAWAAIAAGADPTLVQRVLGHKTLRETHDTYSHLWPDRLDEVLDAVGNHRDIALDEVGEAVEVEPTSEGIPVLSAA